jgi:hypothetical protein
MEEKNLERFFVFFCCVLGFFILIKMNMLIRGNCKGKTESTIYVKSWWEICLQGMEDPLENIQSILEAHLKGRRHTEKNPHYLGDPLSPSPSMP